MTQFTVEPPPPFHYLSHGFGALDSVFDAWQPYTPTITASVGAITTVSASGRYVLIGKTLFLDALITMTTNGTGAGYLICPLPAPYAAKQICMIPGRNYVSGKMLQAIFNLNAAQITNYDNTYPAVNGDSLVITGAFEVG